MKTNEIFLKYFKNPELWADFLDISTFLKYFQKFLFGFIFKIGRAESYPYVPKEEEPKEEFYSLAH